jgi:hypothetical protein
MYWSTDAKQKLRNAPTNTNQVSQRRDHTRANSTWTALLFSTKATSGNNINGRWWEGPKPTKKVVVSVGMWTGLRWNEKEREKETRRSKVPHQEEKPGLITGAVFGIVCFSCRQCVSADDAELISWLVSFFFAQLNQ